MVFCEGIACEEAERNVEDNLVDEYDYRRSELGMSEAKMKMEIDLTMLEQNLVKMASDKIGEEVIDTLVSRFEKKLEKSIEEKLNNMIEERVNGITEGDIYNVEIESNGNKIKLFDLMVSQLISQAKDKSIEFSEVVEGLTKSINYNKIDEDFKKDEFKVLTSYGKDGKSVDISINGNEAFSIWEGEPEDMTLSRDLGDVYKVSSLIKKAYLAGKDGKIMYEAVEEVE